MRKYILASSCGLDDKISVMAYILKCKPLHFLILEFHAVPNWGNGFLQSLKSGAG